MIEDNKEVWVIGDILHGKDEPSILYKIVDMVGVGNPDIECFAIEYYEPETDTTERDTRSYLCTMDIDFYKQLYTKCGHSKGERTIEQMTDDLDRRFEGITPLLDKEYYPAGDGLLKNFSIYDHRWALYKEGRELTLSLTDIGTFTGISFKGKQLPSVIRKAYKYFITEWRDL